MKKLRQIENISEVQQNKIDLTNPVFGMNNAPIPDSYPKLDRAPNSTVVRNEHNALTIYGKDRPSNLGSGYGGAGCTECASIDTVVGLQSMGPGGPQNNTIANPNMMMDSARMLLSQLSDVDYNLGIVAGKIGDVQAQSSAVLKADATRIVARSGGIKLVTGTDPKNSLGANLFATPGIELNAGNDDKSRKVIGLRKEIENLQPIPKGDNLVLFLDKLVEKVDKLASTLDDFMKSQNTYNKLLSSHIHVSTLPGVPTTPSIELMVGTPLIGIVNTAFVKVPNLINRFNLNTTKINHLKNIGPININSRYNRTT
jgi:tetrahydromethanopterin S-methyltransferase subunit B